MWPDELPVRPYCKKGTDADLAADLQSKLCRTCTARLLLPPAGLPGSARSNVFQSPCGKLYHKQPAAQTVQHHAAKDHHWPRADKPQYQKQADHKAESQIFHAEKLSALCAYCPVQTALAMLPDNTAAVLLPGIAYGLQYTG